ncbi:MAG: glucose-6-phosphate dehydrogenase [Acidimicrobiia bacterium]|nr:glucose-6-phosphate dehydrogenase [Acidimicrobiia bacterium]
MADATAASDALVLFGITGDLARRKLFPALYRLVEHGSEIPIVGFASSDWNTDHLRRRARESLEADGIEVEGNVWSRLASLLTYVRGDYRDAATLDPLCATLRGRERPLFYLAIPPALFEVVVENLAAVGLNRNARVVVEKPFGRDLGSSERLGRVIAAAFPEERTFRIDHYLGKEAVQDIMVFRFANAIFEPIWNRRYVSSVQVTMAEEFGVESRGRFYDGVGALRDVVQNHVLQILLLLAMEPPSSSGPEAVRDEKLKVLQAMRSLDPLATVRGQYRGYSEEPGVAVGSDTETYVAARFEIDSWRWAGVPFFVRAGKALPVNATEAVIRFHHPPRLLFAGKDAPMPQRNALYFRIGRSDGVTLQVQAKKPGAEMVSRPVDLDVDFHEVLGAAQEPYERLLGDAMAGRQTLFARADSVNESWRVIQPVLDRPQPVHVYDRGGWGPEASFYMLAEYGGWHDPRDAA